MFCCFPTLRSALITSSLDERKERKWIHFCFNFWCNIFSIIFMLWLKIPKIKNSSYFLTRAYSISNAKNLIFLWNDVPLWQWINSTDAFGELNLKILLTKLKVNDNDFDLSSNYVNLMEFDWFSMEANVLIKCCLCFLQLHSQNEANRPHFVAITTLEDVQAVRCAEFHPNGRVYSVGSNSKTFRICEYPSLSEIRWVIMINTLKCHVRANFMIIFA